MSRSKFYDKISKASIEREIEDIYNEGLALYFDNATITHPFACDGLIDTKEQGKLCKLIMEYKYDKDFKNAVSRASVIVQVLYYIKRFEENGLILPNICLVGDINECFVFHTNDIQKYLSYDLDWSIAPSGAHVQNPDLVLEIAKDEVINPFIFNIDENFSFKDVADKIKDLAVNVKRLVNVTEHNIAIIYEYFCNNVVKDAKSIQSNDLVAVFVNSITDRDSTFLHPKKKDVLVSCGREIHIHSNAYNSFFSYFNKNYTPQEKSNFSKISDRLIEDTNRRNKGEFYTPTTFVDKAHRMIEKALGEDWKEKYVVWDNSSGTKNLTRDYRFNELYCSTLEQGELNQCTDYNKESVSFQFDFLNDSLDKLPKGLLDALKANKPIVFFLNPPYATGCSGVGKSKEKGTTSTTLINGLMKSHNIGACSENLYAQFLYRILMIKREFNLTDCHIALFSPTLFLTGSSWAKFRNAYLNEFAFDNAVQFKASHFADCADTWGISFSIWHNGETTDKNNFNYTSIDKENGEIVEIGKKDVYNTDGLKTASDWAKEQVKQIKTKKTIALTSGIGIAKEEQVRGAIFDGALGYFLNGSNNVDKNWSHCALFSWNYSNGHGHGINADNFDRCTALFAARKLIEKNWVNSKDEYLVPNTNHDKWNEFVNDSLIYSLFHSSSNQSSLRNVEYKEKLWNIKNEFFWRSASEMAELANACGNDEMYNDARTSSDRYVYKKLQDITLSPEAQAVLDKANEILDKTVSRRMVFNAEHPEYQVCNWDIGFYQIKAMATNDELKEFKVVFDKLSEKMRPMVYELGFLK